MRITALIALAVLGVASAMAQTAFLPLKDVRAGQKGIGRTVFSGSTVEEFQVEILGVLDNIGPRESIILARLSGGPLAKTGVMQGMSGSPVWIDGKLVGAVALAFPFATEPVAGIRPIEDMLASPPAAGKARPRAEVKLGESRLVEVATPVSFSGFTASAIEHFAPEWRKLGLAPLQGVGGQSRSTASAAPLQPGSMISVQLVAGDLSVGADGTVTHIDGERIYAFGHRFLSTGTTEMPFTRSEVVALLPNLSQSFKISASRDRLGTITQDSSAAISGVLGRRASMIPVTLNVAGASRSNTYRMEMVENATLTPVLLQMILFSAIDATERTLGSSTVWVDSDVAFDGALPPLKLRQSFAGDINTPVLASLSTASPLAYLMQTADEPIRVKSIALQVRTAESRKVWQIDQITASRREVRPGEELELSVVFSGEGGQQDMKRVKYTVPEGAPEGSLSITVADGTTSNLAESRSLLSASTRPARQVLSLLNAMRGNSSAWVRVWRPEQTYTLGGVEAGNLPAGMEMLLSRSQPLHTVGLASGGAKLAEIEIPLGDGVVAGSKTIQVEVKE